MESSGPEIEQGCGGSELGCATAWGFIKVQPEDLKRIWDAIRVGVMASCPPNIPMRAEHVRNVLMHILAGLAQCWVLFRRDSAGSKQLHACIVTVIDVDRISKARSLQIWAAYGFRPSPQTAWTLVADTLSAWGRAQNCTSIYALTQNVAVASLCLRLGATKNTMMAKEL